MKPEEIEAFLKYYLKLGLKLTTVEKSHNDSNNPRLKEQFGSYLKTQSQNIDSEKDLQLIHNKNDLSGIGLSLENSKLLCLDIDHCFSDTHLKIILSILGLPQNYEWVIKTGSGNGYHIILDFANLNLSDLYIDLTKFENIQIYDPSRLRVRSKNGLIHFGDLITLLSIPASEELNSGYFLLGTSNSKIKSFRVNKKYQNSFEKIQIMTDKHSLLPPSKHKSGLSYTFNNKDLPTSYPKTILADSLFSLIEEFCIDSHILHMLEDYEIGYTSLDFKKFYGQDLTLIIDFETTELIRDVDYFNISEFPEIIQVAWIITDGNDIIYSESSLNSDINTIIPQEISNLTGIDNKKCKEVGRPLSVIADMLINDLEKVESIFAYNLEFDLKCLKNILFRTSRPFDLNSKKQICVMKYAFENKQRINGYKGDKWLKLSDLFVIMFPDTTISAHTAPNDTLMTYKIFKELFAKKQVDKPEFKN